MAFELPYWQQSLIRKQCFIYTQIYMYIGLSCKHMSLRTCVHILLGTQPYKELAACARALIIQLCACSKTQNNHTYRQTETLRWLLSLEEQRLSRKIIIMLVSIHFECSPSSGDEVKHFTYTISPNLHSNSMVNRADHSCQHSLVFHKETELWKFWMPQGFVCTTKFGSLVV